MTNVQTLESTIKNTNTVQVCCLKCCKRQVVPFQKTSRTRHLITQTSYQQSNTGEQRWESDLTFTATGAFELLTSTPVNQSIPESVLVLVLQGYDNCSSVFFKSHSDNSQIKSSLFMRVDTDVDRLVFTDKHAFHVCRPRLPTRYIRYFWIYAETLWHFLTSI